MIFERVALTRGLEVDAGGSVHDHLMGLPIKDRDRIAVVVLRQTALDRGFLPVDG